MHTKFYCAVIGEKHCSIIPQTCVSTEQKGMEIITIREALERFAVKGSPEAPALLQERFETTVLGRLRRTVTGFDEKKDIEWSRPKTWRTTLPENVTVDYTDPQLAVAGEDVLAKALAAALGKEYIAQKRSPRFAFRKRGGRVELCKLKPCEEPKDDERRIFVFHAFRDVWALSVEEFARTAFFDDPEQLWKAAKCGVFKFNPEREMLEQDAFEKMFAPEEDTGEQGFSLRDRRRDFTLACGEALERLVPGFSSALDLASDKPWTQPWKSGRKPPKGIRIDPKDVSLRYGAQRAMGRAYGMAVCRQVSEQVEREKEKRKARLAAQREKKTCGA